MWQCANILWPFASLFPVIITVSSHNVRLDPDEEEKVDFIRIHIGGKGIILLTGKIDALKSAIIPAIEYLKEDGTLAGYSLIINLHEAVLR